MSTHTIFTIACSAKDTQKRILDNVQAFIADVDRDAVSEMISEAFNAHNELIQILADFAEKAKVADQKKLETIARLQELSDEIDKEDEQIWSLMTESVRAVSASRAQIDDDFARLQELSDEIDKEDEQIWSLVTESVGAVSASRDQIDDDFRECVDKTAVEKKPL